MSMICCLSLSCKRVTYSDFNSVLVHRTNRSSYPITIWKTIRKPIWVLVYRSTKDRIITTFPNLSLFTLQDLTKWVPRYSILDTLNFIVYVDTCFMRIVIVNTRVWSYYIELQFDNSLFCPSILFKYVCYIYIYYYGHTLSWRIYVT